VIVTLHGADWPPTRDWYSIVQFPFGSGLRVTVVWKEASVQVSCALFLFVPMKLGTVQSGAAVGEALGVGVGVAVGVGSVVADGSGVAVALGVGEGEGVGAGTATCWLSELHPLTSSCTVYVPAVEYVYDGCW
jgi:hypothetical protein